MAGRILIIEDDPVNARLLSSYCSQRGYHSEIAKNGAEGLLRFFQGPPYDGIFLDLCMPGVSGQEALKVLDSLFEQGLLSQHPRIVVVTSVSNASELSQITKLESVLGVVGKPLAKSSIDLIFRLIEEGVTASGAPHQREILQ